MKKMIIAALTAAAMMALTACPATPGDETMPEAPTETETEAPTETETEVPSEEETEAPAETEPEEPAETTHAPQPAEIPFDDEAYVEFDEPIAYNVVNDTVVYRDSALVTVLRDLPAGGMVIGLGSDGNYIITDAQEFVPLADLEAMQ